MLHDGANGRMRTSLAAWAAAAVTLPIAMFAASAVHAQAIRPNLNIAPRPPVINPHVDGNIVGHTVTSVGRAPPIIHTPSLALRPVSPYLHTSPNLYPACGAANRGADGECLNVLSTTNGDGGPTGKGKGKGGGPRRDTVQTTALNLQAITDELVAEIEGSEAQVDEVARRHGLRRIASQNFPLIGATVGLFRITDHRPADVVSREFATEASVHSVQLQYRYFLQEQKQEQKTALSEGDTVQYALEKLRLPEAHTLAHGANVKVAVIDSGIDIRHPELASSILESYDALGSSEGPHVHGTAVAGAIVAHGRLTGSAPAAQILAIRAFGAGAKGAQSNSYVILKALDYAAGHGARIINMSFAGPQDPLIERGLTAVAMRGILMVAAAGNAGAKSPPLYPAADPVVIAVSATDAHDHLFSASNRGGYIAVAAPGVDVFLPAPDEKYQITSGTSFSAAYVSGLAALMLERNPALKPDEVRVMLMRTARDLGSPGRDDLFGAGEADAFAAVQAAIAAPIAPPIAAPLAPVASTSAPVRENPGENAREGREIPPVRALTPSVSTMAAEKATAGNAVQPAAQ